MYNLDADEGLTSQDHENREWRPTDVLLVFVALLIVFAMLLLLCSGSPWIGGYGYLPDS